MGGWWGGWGVRLALPLCSLSVCLLYISLELVSVAENYKASASSLLAFTQPSSVSRLFFCPSSSSCMHRNAHVSIATPRFSSDTHDCPVDFDPQISVSRDRSLTRLGVGGVTEMSVFSFHVHETESARCNKWRARDERACDPIFSPLRFWTGFSVQPLCDTCDMNLTSLHLCCCLAGSDSLFSITDWTLSYVN